MKAEDLMVGNWVYNPVQKINVIVDSMLIYKQSISEIGLKEKHKGFEPIPLTEEWLLRLGFEEQMKWTYRMHLRGNMYLVYYLGEKGWSIGNKNYYDFPCKHVHKLQQLIKSLKE